MKSIALAVTGLVLLLGVSLAVFQIAPQCTAMSTDGASVGHMLLFGCRKTQGEAR